MAQRRSESRERSVGSAPLALGLYEVVWEALRSAFSWSWASAPARAREGGALPHGPTPQLWSAPSPSRRPPSTAPARPNCAGPISPWASSSPGSSGTDCKGKPDSTTRTSSTSCGLPRKPTDPGARQPPSYTSASAPSTTASAASNNSPAVTSPSHATESTSTAPARSTSTEPPQGARLGPRHRYPPVRRL